MTLATTILETTSDSTSTSPSNPHVSIIWMHGLGADGNDFVPIVKELDLVGCPPIRFVFPNAPRIPVTINGGYNMPAWYDIRAANIMVREDEAGVRASQAAIEELIQIERSKGAQKIILAGFSQGCAMALHTGLRHTGPLAGLLCLSGYVPLSYSVIDELQPISKSVPIFMAHGDADTIVPHIYAEQSRDLLKKLGYQVEWHTYAMEHSVCMLEILEISAWLRKVLKN